MPNEPVVVKITVMSNGKIDRRKEADPDVVLRVGDKVTWICPDVDFMVYDVERDCDQGAGCSHPTNSPFGAPMTRPGTGIYTPAGGKITSPPVVAEARGHLYKATWETRKTVASRQVISKLDPHIIVK